MIELYLSKNNNEQSEAYGEYTREELNKDGKLGWTDKAAQEIAAATAALTAIKKMIFGIKFGCFGNCSYLCPQNMSIMGKRLVLCVLMAVVWSGAVAQDVVSAIRQHYAEAQQMVAQYAEWEKEGEMPCPEYYEVNIVQNLPGTGYHRERMRMYYYEEQNEDWEPDEAMLTRSLHFATVKYNYAAREFYEEYLYDKSGNIEFAYNRDADMDDFKGGEIRLYFNKGQLLKAIVSIRNPETGKYEQTYTGAKMPEKYASEYEFCLQKIAKCQRLFDEIDRDTFH